MHSGVMGLAWQGQRASHPLGILRRQVRHRLLFGYDNLKCATHNTGAVYRDGPAKCADSLLQPCLWCAGAGALIDEGGVVMGNRGYKAMFHAHSTGIFSSKILLTKLTRPQFLDQWSRLLTEASRFSTTCLFSHLFRRITPRGPNYILPTHS